MLRGVSPELMLRPSLSEPGRGPRVRPDLRVSPELMLRPSLSALPRKCLPEQRAPRVAGAYAPAFVERLREVDGVGRRGRGVSPELMLRPSLSGRECWPQGMRATIDVSPELMLRPSLSVELGMLAAGAHEPARLTRTRKSAVVAESTIHSPASARRSASVRRVSPTAAPPPPDQTGARPNRAATPSAVRCPARSLAESPFDTPFQDFRFPAIDLLQQHGAYLLVLADRRQLHDYPRISVESASASARGRSSMPSRCSRRSPPNSSTHRAIG